jgi:alkylhydroperoxidase family enzyme
MPRRAWTACAIALCLGGPAAADPRLPLLANDDAWRRLPGAPPAAEPLPAWARALAGPMPITTARMLELDALHRSGDRLDGRLRAVARWAAADANRSPYTRAMAAADFARAGGDPAVLATPDRLPLADRLAAAFARRMMLEAHAVTDAEVRQLIDLLGEERTMAVVALVAHASFQDRVALALNVEPEAGGVPPPVAARFARPKPKPAAGGGPPTPAADGPAVAPSADWDRTRQGLAGQRARPGRIRVPTAEAVRRRLGDGHPGLWQTGIVWSRVAYGYQPELTDAWFDAAGAFRQESALDPVFSNSLFWVVTDAVKCFY